MSTSGHILTDINKYDTNKCIKDIKNSIINAGLYTVDDGTITYNDKGEIEDYQTCILDKTAFFYDSNSADPNRGKALIIYADSVNTAEQYDWVPNNNEVNKFYSVIFFEKIGTREQILFQFTYEYLKLNPHDCLWVEDDWVYTLSDMEKLKQRPFDPDWCYKDPRNL